jgi:hypothetical protein
MLLAHAYCVIRDKHQYTVFKTLTETKERQQVLRKWVVESILLYGAVPLVCLFAIGHGNALLIMPESLRVPSDSLNYFIASDHGGIFGSMLQGFSMAIIPGLLVGHTAFALRRTWFQHKNQQDDMRRAIFDVRDVEHLFPRNRDERFWTALLSISAGINEELCFRLLIPLLIAITTGSWILAVIAATVWFGLAHYYQGWFGVLVTMFLGTIFFYVYLLTQNIWLVMLMHAILDLNDLAFAPWLADWLDRRQTTN